MCEAGTGGSNYALIVGNRCRAGGFSNIALFNSAFSKLDSNYSWEANGSGIYISGACDWSQITNNYCFRNAKTTLTDAGIRIVDPNNIFVTGNRCFDDLGTKTQNWGIRANEGTIGVIVITNNDVRFNKTAGMALSGSPNVSRNLGWITEAVGNVSLSAAATSITVTHGMDMTPNYRTVKLIGIGGFTNTTGLQAGNVGATTFTIYANVAPGIQPLTVGWQAAYEP